MEQINERPLITITNIIWSFDWRLRRPQVLLIKRAHQPFQYQWALPETLMHKDESADEACIRLIQEKIGLSLSKRSTEQLATFTDPGRVPGTRALALAYMTFLPQTPTLKPGYGALDAQWYHLGFDHHQYFLSSGYQKISLTGTASSLAFDHAEIISMAIQRIRNKLDYQPTILRILGHTFTLRQAREVYAAFLQKSVDQIDNSNFKKTHQRLFEEAGMATNIQHSGRPPKIYRLGS